MKGLQRRKLNFSTDLQLKGYSGSDKNTLKSRIHAMDKGWIGKKRDIRKMNRITENVMHGV